MIILKCEGDNNLANEGCISICRGNWSNLEKVYLGKLCYLGGCCISIKGCEYLSKL